MSTTPLEDENFSRAGGAVAALFTSLPFVALGGAALLGPLAFAAGVIAGPWLRVARIAKSGGVALGLFAAFLIWAGASLTWSTRPDPAALVSLVGAGAMVMLAMAAGFARPADIAIARRAGIIGVGVLMGLLAIDAVFEFPIAQALAPQAKGGSLDLWLAGGQRAAALASLWIWGAAAMLARSRNPTAGWAIAAFMALALIGIGLALPDRRILLALAVALVPAACALALPRGALAWTAVGLGIAAIAAPLYLPYAAALACQAWRGLAHQEPPIAWLARLDTWAYAADRIHENLISGWGLGASKAFTAEHALSGFETPYIPGDPQSLPVHLWLETGAIGATLAAAALAAFGLRAGAALARDRLAAAAAAGAMTTASTIAVTSVAAWDLWWWAGVAVAAALVRSARAAP
jgi:hypothetical protein